MLTYQNGDLIWAKMKGFSPWPAQVVVPLENIKRPSTKKPVQPVYFFGTDDYAWIEEAYIIPFFTAREKLSVSNRTSKFKEAVSAIENYILENEEVVEKQKRREKEGNTVEKRERKDSEADKKTQANGSKSTPKRKRKARSLADATNSAKRQHTDQNDVDKKSRAKPALNFITRPTPPPRPDTPPVDMESLSQYVADKNITPSDMKFGFIGLGTMGKGIARNLIASGHKLVVWNRTADVCREFVESGAEEALTPSDVVAASDITFSCVTDSSVTKKIVFGNCGVLDEIKPGKGYVEMTSIDSETSQDNAEAVSRKGGRYLEAQIQGTRKNANEGSLVLIAAGDRSLFLDCQSCFKATGNQSFYVGEVGSASKMNLILQLMHGVTIAALAESLALADRAGLAKKDVLEILSLCEFSSNVMMDKGKAMEEGRHEKSMALSHMQKDLKLVLEMSEQLEQPAPLTAAANEMFKISKRAGYHDFDVSAVFIRTRY